MPNSTRNHDECRKAVCLLCFSKTKVMRNISSQAQNIIEEHILCGFDEDDVRLPTVLCSNCYTIVYEYGKQNFTRTVTLFDHSSLTERPARSSSNTVCNCKVCEHARASTASNLSASSVVLVARKPGPKTSSVHNPSKSGKTEAMKICSHCFLVLGRGKPHTCPANKRHVNLLNIASSSETKEKLVSSVVLEKKRQVPGSVDTFSFASPNGRCVNLSTSPSSSCLPISSHDMHRIQTEMNLSTNRTHTLSKHLRSAIGQRSAVEVNLKEKLKEMNHRLDGHFVVEDHSFVTTSSNATSSNSFGSVVFCRSLEDLKQCIVEQRNYDSSQIRSTIGIDGGGEFLKVCLTVQSSFFNTENHRVAAGVHHFKDSGVKKTFILAIVKDIPENYRNILTLWNILKLTNDPEALTPYTCSMDLKLANIMLGLMSHSSSHPCSWCDVPKSCLGKKGRPRTLGTIRAQYWSFVDSGKDLSQAKEFGNTIHPPIFKNADDTSILDIIPPPELHLLLGSVNTLYKHLTNVWPNSHLWTDAVHVTREAIHGGSFNGNSCRKLLQSIDVLEEISPADCKNFILAFRALNDVIHSCFSKDLDHKYVQKIEIFKRAYDNLHIPVTPKIHAIYFHVEEFCRRQQTGLGCWSEQSFESVHCDFKSTWMKYKVPDNHRAFSQQLLRAVCEYNSRHL